MQPEGAERPTTFGDGKGGGDLTVIPSGKGQIPKRFQTGQRRQRLCKCGRQQSGTPAPTLQRTYARRGQAGACRSIYPGTAPPSKATKYRFVLSPNPVRGLFHLRGRLHQGQLRFPCTAMPSRRHAEPHPKTVVARVRATPGDGSALLV